MRTAIVAAVLALGACTSASREGEGDARPTAQRSFEVGAFHAVEVEGAHDVTVAVGGAPAVRAEGDAKALEELDIRVENGVLRIGSERRGWSPFNRNRRGVTIQVAAPALDAASISGSGDLRVDRVESEAFQGSVAGSGDLSIGALQVRRADFAIAGSGEIEAAGTAEEAEISIAGSGNAALDALRLRRASVSVAGSGDVRLNASETVNGEIMGSGDLVVQGGARCSVSKMGSGDVRCG